MNKLTLIPLFSVLSFSSFTYAGGMGESGLANTSGFVSLEGGYATSTIANFNFDIVGFGGGAIESIKTNENYAGRLAGGLINMMDDQFGVTSEIGWGYYGRTYSKNSKFRFWRLNYSAYLYRF